MFVNKTHEDEEIMTKSKILGLSFVLSFAVFFSEFAYTPFAHSIFTPYRIPGASYQIEIAPLHEKIAEVAEIPKEKAKKYTRWIEKAVEDKPMTPQTLAAVVMTESTYKEKAKSGKGAVGIAQIMPRTFNHICKGKEVGGTRLTSVRNPKHNIYCAAIILEDYRERYCDGSEDCALKHYVAGPGNLKAKKSSRKHAKFYLKTVRNYETLLSYTDTGVHRS